MYFGKLQIAHANKWLAWLVFVAVVTCQVIFERLLAYCITIERLSVDFVVRWTVSIYQAMISIGRIPLYVCRKGGYSDCCLGRARFPSKNMHIIFPKHIHHWERERLLRVAQVRNGRALLIRYVQWLSIVWLCGKVPWSTCKEFPLDLLCVIINQLLIAKGDLQIWHPKNFWISRLPPPCTGLHYRIHVTSLTTSAFPWPPSPSNVDIIFEGP